MGHRRKEIFTVVNKWTSDFVDLPTILILTGKEINHMCSMAELELHVVVRNSDFRNLLWLDILHSSKVLHNTADITHFNCEFK